MLTAGTSALMFSVSLPSPRTMLTELVEVMANVFCWPLIATIKLLPDTETDPEALPPVPTTETTPPDVMWIFGVETNSVKDWLAGGDTPLPAVIVKLPAGNAVEPFAKTPDVHDAVVARLLTTTT